MTWIRTPDSLGLSLLYDLCVVGNKFYVADRVDDFGTGGSTTTSPFGDIYRFDTDTLAMTRIYDGSTVTSPMRHRALTGICSFQSSIYAMVQRYNPSNALRYTLVIKWNGSSWDTVLTEAGTTYQHSYGRLVTDGSRMYALMVESNHSVPPTHQSKLFYTDDGIAWTPGTITGDPLRHTNIAAFGHRRPGLSAQFPNGIYFDLSVWTGSVFEYRIFTASGTSVGIHFDNNPSGNRYRNTGPELTHWQNDGNPPSYWDSGFTTTTSPSGGVQQIMSINMTTSMGIIPYDNDRTEIYKFDGVTGWTLWDTLQDIPIIGPNLRNSDCWLLKLNGNYWVLAYNYETSVFEIWRKVVPPEVSTIYHIAKSGDTGASWSVVIDDWEDDHCGALQVSDDQGGGQRKFWTVRNEGPV